jgi:hypothetical protein
MIGPDHLARVTAQAVVPEQVIPYVRAVAGTRPCLVGPCVGYAFQDAFTVVGYPLLDPRDEDAMARAVEQALGTPGLRRITVMGPALPPQAPPGSCVRADQYLSVPVPPPGPGQKLRNLLGRPGRELRVEQGGTLGEAHRALIRRYLDRKALSLGTRRIYGRLPQYLAASPGSVLLSARLADGRLAAFAVGEFSSLHTAMYMFAFRDPEAAPPGSSDLLLSHLLEEARIRGQARMNLGLGVNPGIRSFKAKWGAGPFLPYVEASWDITPSATRRLRDAPAR